MSVEYGTFRAAITPLLHKSTSSVPAFTLSDYQWITQFQDVSFSHPLNDGRSASLVISMHDPIAADLRPWEQALMLMYVRPGVDPNLGERVIWGQCNVIDDYENQTVTLQVDDPSLRLRSHYLRVGDEALNKARNPGQGRIFIDDRGLLLLVKAGYFGDADTFPDAALLGLAVHGRMNNRTPKMPVERGQEVWATIMSISEAVGGPDYDLKPNHNADGDLPGGSVSEEGKCYAVLNAFNPPFTPATGGSTAELMRDLTGTVAFEYGYPADNVTSVTVTPERPTNDAIVIDSAQSARSRGQYPPGIDTVGVFQDWVSYDIKTGWEPNDLLEEYATAHIKTFARPLFAIDVELRPDVGQDFFYGDPSLLGPLGSAGHFYLGDVVTVRAQQGTRNFAGEYRIVKVELGMSGSRGPITTKVELQPDPSELTGWTVNTANTRIGRET